MGNWEKVDSIPSKGERKLTDKGREARADIEAFIDSPDEIWRKEFPKEEINKMRNVYMNAIRVVGYKVRIFQRQNKYIYLQKVEND